MTDKIFSSTSAILWQNEDQSIALIDVPRSISIAQGSVDDLNIDEILSSEPLQKQHFYSGPQNTNISPRYAELLEHALQEVRSHHVGEWCLPRRTEYGDDDQDKISGGQFEDVRELLRDLTSRNGTDFDHHPGMTCEDCHADGTILRSNCTEDTFLLSTVHPARLFRFRIPPRASFCLSECGESSGFRNAVRAQAQAHETNRLFHCILLDPPWSNKSARRGRRYQTPLSVDKTRRMIIETDLDMLMAENCMMGVWITNSPSVRSMMLGEGGIFDSWGIELVEEWTWLKTTVDGTPILPLRAAQRKPYEVLLVGRRRTGSHANLARVSVPVKHRILIGVPDVHSRKPCLKELIEPLLPEDPRVLEVFARNLVAGWWSWGDECIKYNWEGGWKSK